MTSCYKHRKMHQGVCVIYNMIWIVRPLIAVEMIWLYRLVTMMLIIIAWWIIILSPIVRMDWRLDLIYTGKDISHKGVCVTYDIIIVKPFRMLRRWYAVSVLFNFFQFMTRRMELLYIFHQNKSGYLKCNLPLGRPLKIVNFPSQNVIDNMTQDNYYCKSLKYSGNNRIAIIALCPYALL